MSETLATIHRLTPLADVFWREVTAAPWRYDLFHLLRRIDAQGRTLPAWARAAAEIRIAAHRANAINGVCARDAGQRAKTGK